ncbi:phenazine biosynthesis protein PhzF family [Nakamurella panacisegetis]|uniref:Phenazine biosynthesis protein PhzF family n=1 Tax=Nakamurella panacisegetis TaxID=1090615 RepID=A0A1H0K186_9ACTN|nr:PhzF family phenazine biosynthesis isomerase [Nakamurella panacisegetis]SDO49619.1 phenazine biosynthesis protein PhzF family [Nakamurella panacisegetis]
MTTVLIQRYAAFSTTPDGGNPAGVVLDAGDLTDDQMQHIAADIGYAETAFLTRFRADGEPRRGRIRYFSPVAEVPFCGHATIATAVALAARDGLGAFTFETGIGDITLATAESDGYVGASFTSVEPSIDEMPYEVLAELLELLGLSAADLRADYPHRFVYAGNTHPLLVLREPERFDSFTFDPDELRARMNRRNWPATVIVARVISPTEFEARNLFPVGSISEDPATGAAAAAFGGYLRALHLIHPPADVVIHQGRHVGRPSRIAVHVPEAGGIVVSGTAVEIQAPLS